MKQGALVGRYVLDACVGESESVETWQAHLTGTDDVLGRTVALRIVRADRARDVRRLRTEFQARGMVRDKRHVLDCYELFEFGPGERGQRWMCLAQEFIPQGSTLRHLIGRAAAGSSGDGSIAMSDAIELLRQAALGLHALHGAGLVHGAVRPEALYVQTVEHGRWLLAVGDLGAAHSFRPPADAADPLNAPTAFNTPRYSAPEAFTNEMNPKTDAYCLGFTFYELLAGRAAFEEQFAAQLGRGGEAGRDERWRAWHTDRTLRATPVRELCPDCPEEVAGLVDGLCRKEPAIRSALEDVIGALGAGATASRDERRRPPASAVPPEEGTRLRPLDADDGPAREGDAARTRIRRYEAGETHPGADSPPIASVRIVPLGASAPERTFDMTTRDRIRLGRKPDNDVVFDAEDDRVVSSYHATVAVRHGRVVVRDAGSLNGTWINGIEVKLESEALPADVVRLGQNGPAFRIETAVPAARAGGRPRAGAVRSPGPAAAEGDPRPAGTASRRRRLLLLLALVTVTSVGVLILVEQGRSGAAAPPSKAGEPSEEKAPK